MVIARRSKENARAGNTGEDRERDGDAESPDEQENQRDEAEVEREHAANGRSRTPGGVGPKVPPPTCVGHDRTADNRGKWTP